MVLTEVFEYPFTRIDPVLGDHVDPPSVAIYHTLLVKGASGQPAPGLAESWAISADGLRWTLRLRPGARFHSGATCDATAVVAALQQCRWGPGLSRQIWYWDAVETVVAVDPTTVVLTLHHPSARLPVLLWGSHTAIANATTRDNHPGDYGRALADGTGPFALSHFSEQEVVARRRDDAAGLAREIRWLAALDPDARRAYLDDEEIGVIRDIRDGWVAEDDPRWRVERYHENSQFYLALNFDRFGFDRLQARQAIEAWIDREQLVEVGLAGHGDPRRSPIPRADEFADAYDAAAVTPMTRAASERMLDDLGYPQSDTGVRTWQGQPLVLDCVTQDTAIFRRLCEVLAAQLREAGIVLRIRYEPVFEDFYQACADGPDAFVSKWLWGDAMEAIVGFSKSDCDADSGGNWQHARCPRVDEAHDAFRQAVTPTALTRASAALQRVFMEELPYVPLCSPMESYAIRRDVHGFEPVPRTLYPGYDRVRVNALA